MTKDKRHKELKRILTAAVTMCLLTAIVMIFNVPNPNMILITGLVVFTSLYGFGSGIISAVIMIIYSMYFFSTDHSFFSYTAVNLQKMSVILLGVVLTLIFVGNLNKRQQDAQQELKEINDALAQDNKVLREASLTDPLTGLRNRYALRRNYDSYRHHEIFVMLMDIDNFKAANDSYGHAAGDYLLSRTGEILSSVFGKDNCYRYGGDEFLIVMTDTDRKAFSALAESARNALENIFLDDKPLPVHFSGGFVYGKNEMQRDMRLMINHADKHLYDAKERGKSCFLGGEFHRAFAEDNEELSVTHK